MQVCGQDFTDGIIERIQAAVRNEPLLSRYALSKNVCEWMNWRSPTGALKDMSCRVALLSLQKRGVIELPPPRSIPVKRKGTGGSLRPPSSENVAVCVTLSELGSVDIVQVGVGGCDTSRIWTELMDRHHYLRSGPLCGAQLRYLIRSERHGWLGGLSFSSAAWAVAARDQWIGWDANARKRHLQNVLSNSRFLIAPHVKVPHLASHALGLCICRLSEDWRQRYGLAPVLLETFVEQERFRGTCYRAANWIHVGSTQGRGRQDRGNCSVLPIKDVYVYPLVRNARERLREGMPTVSVSDESAGKPVDWAAEEFGGAPLGDERLAKRLVTIARDFGAKPQANIPQASGSRAKTKAAYRFFEHEKTTMKNILQPHYEATRKRLREHHVVLAVQDTTSLNYSAHPAMEKRGPIGSSPDGAMGLLVHDTLAISAREGVPLGLLDVQCWTRDPKDYGKKHQRHALPIEQKESNKWLKSYQAVSEAQKRCPDTLLVSVGDREADIYELFELATRDKGGPKLLVRAERARFLADGQKQLWEKITEEPLAGIQELHVPRRGSRPARIARLEVRFMNATLAPPRTKSHLPDVTVWAILAKEQDAPEGIEALEWMLITTVETNTFQQAVERLSWYASRWGIEVYHRTLKSGCKIEERQLGSADSIAACLGVDMVVAWRVFHLTKLGREVPDVPCSVFFEDAEWKALTTFVTKNIVPPAEPPSLQEAVRMVGSLGGHLGRKGDGEPGTKALWLGLQRLDDIVAMWKIMVSQLAPHFLTQVVSSTRYG